MAFSLSDRMAVRGGRIADDEGGGFQGSTASFDSSATDQQRGGQGSEAKQPHSAAGFRRALRKTAAKSNTVISGINKTDSSMGNNRKPNYFAQGGHRHGFHIGSGGPATIPKMDEGSEGWGE